MRNGPIHQKRSWWYWVSITGPHAAATRPPPAIAAVARRRTARAPGSSQSQPSAASTENAKK